MTTIAKSASIFLGLLLAAGGLMPCAKAVSVPEELIRQKVAAFALEKVGALVNQNDRKNVTVDVLKVSTAALDFPKVEKADQIKIDLASPLENQYSERSIVRVRLQDPQGNAREIGVPVRVVIQKAIWVVKNPIDARTPLKVSDFTLETRNVSANYPYAVGRERDLGQYMTRVGMQAGEMLDARKLVMPPDVTANSDVRILLTSENGMTISVPGIAMSDGRVGQNIRVRQAVYQRKTFTARIIDKNRVQVDM